MNLKFSRMILLAILVALFPIVYFSRQLGSTVSVLAILAVLVIYLIAVHFLWRCPHCGRPLGQPGSVPTRCPHCGREL